MQNQTAAIIPTSKGTPQVVALPTTGMSASTASSIISTVRPTTMPVATLPPQPTAVPTLLPGVLFDDDFSSKTASESKGWAFTTNASSERTWSPNQMVVSLKSAGVSDLIMPNGEYDDFGIEVQVQPQSGSLGVVALTFRYSVNGTNRSSYSFGITPQGEYYLAKTVNGIPSRPSPVELTRSSLISQGMKSNILGVIVKGKLIKLFINRTQVMSIFDDSIQGKGKIGVAFNADQGAAVVAFSRFTVYTPEQALVAWCPLQTTALPSGVLFDDDFSSQQSSGCNGWWLGKTSNAEYNWSANLYQIANMKADWLVTDSPSREYGDFGLEIEAQPVNDVNMYGLTFRFTANNDINTYYLFAVTPNGKFTLQKRVSGVWQTAPVAYTNSSVIKTGLNKNRLGVIAQGNSFSLYINRTLVKTVTDDTIKGPGYIGLGVSSGATVPATVDFSRVTVLTPDKARADWGGTTVAPSVPTVASRPTAPIAPGLYVTGLRFEPAPPKRGQDIGFYATFLNTATGEQNTRWTVYVYRADNLRNSFGETTATLTTIPVGQKEQKVLGSWKLSGGGECENFIARVGWKNENNQTIIFNKPDGSLFEQPFTVCP
jgi:hypothetical protein